MQELYLSPTGLLKVLEVTTLFPNSAQPELGLFVFERAKALSRVTRLEIAAVIGDFPPLRPLRRFRDRPRSIPRSPCGNATVHRIPYLSVPRFAKTTEGRRIAKAIQARVDAGEISVPDIILADLAFPDGDCANELSQRWGIPYVVTLRGHDVNSLPKNQGRLDRLRRTLEAASFVLPVADALGRAALDLGAVEARTKVVANGVDQSCFQPRDREEARRSLGIPLDARLVLSVGHLVERKGHHLIVGALARLDPAEPSLLAIVGGPSEEGDATGLVRDTIRRLGLEDRVLLLGALKPSAIANWLAAADCLVLASEKEGRPNVVLEALACARPVVATRVWGTEEILNSSELGILVDERTPEALALGISECLASQWSESALRSRVTAFSWDDSARHLESTMRSALSRVGKNAR